jgi:hypothetical protein
MPSLLVILLMLPEAYEYSLLVRDASGDFRNALITACYC